MLRLSHRLLSKYPEVMLQTLWQYALRFRIEELFLDSKSGVFQLEESKIRHPQALERLYLVVAQRIRADRRQDDWQSEALCALLFATVHGMTVELEGLRTQVDPHWERGLSHLKIGLRWLKGILHKGRDLFEPNSLLSHDFLPCFASSKAKREYYHAIWFTRISELKCRQI
ncbi:MAG: hypothetical protein AAGK10_15980 [Cyanobacteria bacterium J06555_3]